MSHHFGNELSTTTSNLPDERSYVRVKRKKLTMFIWLEPDEPLSKLIATCAQVRAEMREFCQRFRVNCNFFISSCGFLTPQLAGASSSDVEVFFFSLPCIVPTAPHFVPVLSLVVDFHLLRDQRLYVARASCASTTQRSTTQRKRRGSWRSETTLSCTCV